MKANIHIGPLHSLVTCTDPIALGRLKDHLSYTDKSVQYQLFVFKKGKWGREKKMIEKYGELPTWYRESQEKKLEELENSVRVCCWEDLDDGVATYTGLAQRSMDFLKEMGATVEVSYEEAPEAKKRILSRDNGGYLRRPQQECLDLIVNGSAPNIVKNSGLIVLPTACGKTVLASQLIKHFGVRTIFLVPSTSILKQTLKRFEKDFGKTNVKQFGGGTKKVGFVTVATFQSVNLAAPDLFNEVDMIVADEVHTIGARTFFQARLNIRNATKVFGLSATPQRLDGGELMIEAACGPTIYDFPVRTAIDEGYLARPSFVMYEVSDTRGTFERFETKKVGRKTVKKSLGMEDAFAYKGKNDNEAYKHWTLGNDKLNEFVAEMARAEAAAGGSVLIMIDELQHGQKLKALLPEAGYSYGANKDNEKLQKQYNNRELRILVGSSTIGIGTDIIPTTLQILLQGGGEGPAITQADGRALRNDPDENGVPRKPTVTIIDFDFVGNARLHKQAQGRDNCHAALGEIHRLKLF